MSPPPLPKKKWGSDIYSGCHIATVSPNYIISHTFLNSYIHTWCKNVKFKCYCLLYHLEFRSVSQLWTVSVNNACNSQLPLTELLMKMDCVWNALENSKLINSSHIVYWFNAEMIITFKEITVLTICYGRAIAQAVSRWLLTSAARVRSQVTWDLWWTKWHWGRFSPSTWVSSANPHSSNCSIIIIYHLGLVQ
jgi:hypothetical protein